MLGQSPLTFVVVPDNNYCENKGYSIREYDDFINTYKSISKSDAGFQGASNFLNRFLTEQGLSARVLEGIVNSETEGAGKAKYGELLSSLVKSGMIILYLDLKEEKQGVNKTVNWRLKVVDTLGDKNIAIMSGEGGGLTSQPMKNIFIESFMAKAPELTSKMADYFNDIMVNGRELNVNILLLPESGIKLDKETPDGLLTDAIKKWGTENSLNGAFNMSTDSSDIESINFKVRLPLSSKGEMDTYRWLYKFRKYLKGMGIPIREGFSEQNLEIVKE